MLPLHAPLKGSLSVLSGSGPWVNQEFHAAGQPLGPPTQHGVVGEGAPVYTGEEGALAGKAQEHLARDGSRWAGHRADTSSRGAGSPSPRLLALTYPWAALGVVGGPPG